MWAAFELECGGEAEYSMQPVYWSACQQVKFHSHLLGSHFRPIFSLFSFALLPHNIQMLAVFLIASFEQNSLIFFNYYF